MNQNNNYILKAIDILMDKRVNSLPMTEVFSSPIYGVNTDGTYTIVKEKNKYNVRNGLSSALSLGQNVWVIIPNGSLKDMFICGLNKTGAETYTPSGDINELTNLITQLNSVVNGHTSSIERLNEDIANTSEIIGYGTPNQQVEISVSDIDKYKQICVVPKFTNAMMACYVFPIDIMKTHNAFHFGLDADTNRGNIHLRSNNASLIVWCNSGIESCTVYGVR